MVQNYCCVLDCKNKVQNRTRFSLKSKDKIKFKPNYLKNKWNKICRKHYNQDLCSRSQKKKSSSKYKSKKSPMQKCCKVQNEISHKSFKLFDIIGETQEEVNNLNVDVNLFLDFIKLAQKETQIK